MMEGISPNEIKEAIKALNFPPLDRINKHQSEAIINYIMWTRNQETQPDVKPGDYCISHYFREMKLRHLSESDREYRLAMDRLANWRYFPTPKEPDSEDSSSLGILYFVLILFSLANLLGMIYLHFQLAKTLVMH